jgi:hypothetical protein
MDVSKYAHYRQIYINKETRRIKWDERDVILECLVRRDEFLWIFENIGTDEEVGGALIVFLEELV